MDIFSHNRKSYITFGEIYFWTATIHKWKHLMKDDAYKEIVVESLMFLTEFRVEANNKEYEFWQRDSLAAQILDKEMAFQKLDYIHNNPLAEHWNLVKDPNDYYYYSTCSFYERGVKDFNFVKDIRDEY